jgi:acylphosphatase
MANEDSPARVSLKITGRVQGAYFRASAQQEAAKLGLTGWVMNCADGSVAALAEGNRVELEKFIAWCHDGPPGARVAAVNVDWQTAVGEFAGFGIRR